MSKENQSDGLLFGENFHTLIVIIWAIIMVAATFLIDSRSNVIPFWLLLIVYYITVRRKASRSKQGQLVTKETVQQDAPKRL